MRFVEEDELIEVFVVLLGGSKGYECGRKLYGAIILDQGSKGHVGAHQLVYAM